MLVRLCQGSPGRYESLCKVCWTETWPWTTDCHHGSHGISSGNRFLVLAYFLLLLYRVFFISLSKLWVCFVSVSTLWNAKLNLINYKKYNIVWQINNVTPNVRWICWNLLRCQLSGGYCIIQVCHKALLPLTLCNFAGITFHDYSSHASDSSCSDWCDIKYLI